MKICGHIYTVTVTTHFKKYLLRLLHAYGSQHQPVTAWMLMTYFTCESSTVVVVGFDVVAQYEIWVMCVGCVYMTCVYMTCVYVTCVYCTWLVCLTALLHILENPNSLQQWLRDADMNPLLVQISRIYHAEKYGQWTDFIENLLFCNCRAVA